MKKSLFFSTSLLLASLPIMAEKVVVSTPKTAMVFEIEKGQEPQFLYYGPTIMATDVNNLQKPNDGNWSRAELFPAYGANHTQSETCFAMRHGDGNLSTNLLVDSYSLSPISDKAPNGNNREGNLLTVTLKDPEYPTTVRLSIID